MSRFLITALTLLSTIMSTIAQRGYFGWACVSNSDCSIFSVGDGRCLGPTAAPNTPIPSCPNGNRCSWSDENDKWTHSRCCENTVLDSCGGCGIKGKCNLCDNEAYEVNSAKTGCTKKFTFNAVGSYAKVESGTCGVEITNKAMCETAARSLGLSDTTASERSWSSSPPGCILDNYKLIYNTDSTSTTSCSSNGFVPVVCICPSCVSTVVSSCNGCGLDRMCNTCNLDKNGKEQMVDAAKTGCTISPSTAPSPANTTATDEADESAATTSKISSVVLSAGVIVAFFFI